MIMPHPWIYIEVVRDGKKKLWALEGGGKKGSKHQGGRYDQGAMPSVERRQSRLPARVRQGIGRKRPGLGREPAAAQGFLRHRELTGMRQIVSFVVVVLLSVGTSFAQEWRTYTSKKDRFAVNVPGEPVVTDIIWETEYGGEAAGACPHPEARRQHATPSQWWTTTRSERSRRPRRKTARRVPTGAPQRPPPDVPEPNGIGYWKTDIRGALVYTTFKYLQRDAKVTYYMWNWLGQGPEAHELQLLNADRSKTFVAMYMHHNWLYVVEGTVPDGIPPPVIFQQSDLTLRGGRQAGEPRSHVLQRRRARSERGLPLL